MDCLPLTTPFLVPWSGSSTYRSAPSVGILSLQNLGDQARMMARGRHTQFPELDLLPKSNFRETAKKSTSSESTIQVLHQQLFFCLTPYSKISKITMGKGLRKSFWFNTSQRRRHRCSHAGKWWKPRLNVTGRTSPWTLKLTEVQKVLGNYWPWENLTQLQMKTLKSVRTLQWKPKKIFW